MIREVMNKLGLFNLICLALSGFFVLGTLWVWRGEIRAVVSVEDVEVIPVVERDDIVKDKDAVVVQDIEEVIEVVEEKKVAKEEGAEGLPTKINLAVPFTSQAPEKNWDNPWQNACEEAAVLMLDAYYKGYGLSPLFARDEILKIVEWEEERNWHTSIPIEKVKKLADEYFFSSLNRRTKIIEDPSIKQIKEFVANGNPVLAVADGKVLPNPHYRGDGPVYHALIIRGFTEEKFITNDPGTQFGENFSYYYDDLMNAVHDWNNGDVKKGKPRILVIK